MVGLKKISVVDYPKFFRTLRDIHEGTGSESLEHPDSPLEQADRLTGRFLQEGLHPQDHFLYAIEAGGQDVGYILAGRETERPGHVQVWDMMVYPAHRRRGYGREAMKALEVLLAAQGIKGIDLHVGSANDHAIGLYKGLGFKVTDLVMNKSLG